MSEPPSFVKWLRIIYGGAWRLAKEIPDTPRWGQVLIYSAFMPLLFPIAVVGWAREWEDWE